MKYILDRFEGHYAVLELEDGKDKLVLTSELPSRAKEGDIIEFTNNIYTINIEETIKRRRILEERMKKFKRK
ncbi:DUF3006 domain-containing protein [Sedimentibacter sp. zth1]|uniref:DUF3006 domain-containing protein n=1 Tax=Sedimentibacter sp. zth1 TaxID=2816908 RepID=UPI001A90F940|nr:DUF3006 domain-containing protein [Sedimentibacter sp. zth1]QSX07113.1 DUF3006 domain-containing protein [Sedimentibacter sp. zth1]